MTWRCPRCSFECPDERSLDIVDHAMLHAYEEQTEYDRRRIEADFDRMELERQQAIYWNASFNGPPKKESTLLERMIKTATCLAFKQTAAISTRCYECPYCEPGCVFCAPAAIENGDELRAVVEAELLLSGHWYERHVACNCGHCFWEQEME